MKKGSQCHANQEITFVIAILDWNILHFQFSSYIPILREKCHFRKMPRCAPGIPIPKELSLLVPSFIPFSSKDRAEKEAIKAAQTPQK